MKNISARKIVVRQKKLLAPFQYFTTYSTFVGQISYLLSDRYYLHLQPKFLFHDWS